MAENKIETVFLGNTGVRVSNICLGGMTFGLKSGQMPGWGLPVVSQDESFQILNKYAEWGGNFIDTADAYSMGESETVIGNWLTSKRRDDFVVATKSTLQTGLGPNDLGSSRYHVLSAVQASLQRLKTDHIDLYQMHSWDWGTPIRETLLTLTDLVRSGKVRYFGVSNYTGWQTAKALELARGAGLELLVSHQGQYSLLERGADLEILPLCIDENIAYLPWSPLKGGWLSGRYKRNHSTAAEPGSRVEWASKAGWKATDFQSNATERTWQIVDEVEKIAKETGRSMAQVSLRWCVQRVGVTSTIIGARTVDQLVDNLSTATFKLSAEQMERLNKLSSPDRVYPYDLQISNVGRARSGVAALLP